MLAEYVGIDVETTGTDPERDRIIQIGAVRVAGGRPAGRWSTLVRPGRPVPLAVQRLTGISDAMLAGAPALDEVLPAFLHFLGESPLVAHNAPFDRAFLEAALGRPLAPVYDTLELARLALPGLPSYRLEEVAARLGLAPERSHEALSDAETAALLFWRLAQELRCYPAGALRLAAGFLARDDPLTAALLARAAAAGPPSEGGGAGPGAAGDDGAPGGPLPGAGGAVPGEGVRPRCPLDPAGIASWLAPGGAVAARLPGYEPRPGQVRMLEAVAAALAGGGALVVEAGTGTGKSLAYLLPALARAVSSGQRVVVSTHTVQLQEQIWKQDLPRLEAALPFPFRAALLKGRSHYVCLWKWEAVRDEPGGDPLERRFFARVALWLARTRTGDRVELNVRREEERAWAAVAADDGCAGERCRFHDRCPMILARRRAAEADLVVVNHALLLSDAGAGRQVLPPYRHLICDEAHHLPEAAWRHLALRVDEAEVARLLDALRRHRPGTAPGLLDRLARGDADRAAGEGGAAARALAVAAAAEAVDLAREAAGTLFRSLRAWAGRGAAGRGDARAGRGDGEAGTGAWRLPVGEVGAGGGAPAARGGLPGEARLAQVVEDAGELAGRLRGLAAALAALAPQLEEAVGEEREIRAALLARQQQVEALAGTVEATLLAADDPGAAGPGAAPDVVWFELDAPGPAGEPAAGRVLRAPLNPGPALARLVFEPLETLVLTSATLSVDGRFDYFAGQVGLEAADGLRVASPFDYHEQALLCLATDVPDPGEDEAAYLEAACPFLRELAQALGGRTLVLFTSHRMLREVYRRLKEPLEAADIAVLGQGLDGNQVRLTESFRRNPRAVLLGSASFWEGVDLPGDALRCVVVMRLPFRPPGHPLAEARFEEAARRGEDPFQALAVPEAVLRFKQGFGRLIRRSSDRGAVVVLDPRLVRRQAAYGRAFLNSLPGPRVFLGGRGEIVAAARRWVTEGRAPAVLAARGTDAAAAGGAGVAGNG